MDEVIKRSMLCALVLASAVHMGIEPRPAAAQSVQSSGSDFPSDESYLRLLAPGNEAYRTLDGGRMKRLVAEQTAIARRYRDAGHQYWGRIIGTEADHETAAWMAERLRQAGADVRLERLDLPPQWVPRSWEASVSGSGEVATLASATPTYASPGTPSDGMEVELIDVGLGMETDFRGRDLRGKAVIIHAIPRPGIISLLRSAALRGPSGGRATMAQRPSSSSSNCRETFRRCSIALTPLYPRWPSGRTTVPLCSGCLPKLTHVSLRACGSASRFRKWRD